MLKPIDILEIIPESRIATPYIRAVGGKIPDEWALVPSTFTGKYHPHDEYDYGGLVLHTRRAIDVFFMCYAYSVNCEDKSKIVAALVLHDTGKPQQWSTGYSHAWWAYRTFNDLPEDLRLMILRHGGRPYGDWSAPRTRNEMIVHLCDYWAAKFGGFNI